MVACLRVEGCDEFDEAARETVTGHLGSESVRCIGLEAMIRNKDDSAADVPDYPNVTSYRHRRHETFIAENGAFEIRSVDTGDVAITKPGADGKGVWS